MIPPFFKIFYWTLVLIVIFFFLKKLKEDMKICPVCKKRMWFWQVVYFKVEKRNVGTTKKDFHVPDRHGGCGYGN